MIIGLMGLAGTGKSTAGKILQEKYDFTPIAFAGSLKDAVSVVFGWPRNLLEGNTNESRIFRETQDEYWSEAFGKSITPRYILQYAGTEVFRNWLGDIWIRSVGKKMQDNSKSFVITDMRFYNEINFIKQMNGFIVEIRKSYQPTWVDDATKWLGDNNETDIDGVSLGFEQWANHNLTVHRSEWEAIHYRANHSVDYVLYNDYEIGSQASMNDFAASIFHMMRVFTGPRDVGPEKNVSLDTVMQ